jgi:hypothetical protein
MSYTHAVRLVMDYRSLEALRKSNPAWRLLQADYAPLIIGFLHQNFIQPNIRTMPQDELISRLEDYLFQLREQRGPECFPKPASQYLDDWAADSHGWLRKYYPPNTDEPHYDITHSTERAIEWISSLGRRPLVSTESRLMIVFEILRQMVEGTEMDAAARVRELERRKAQIQEEIERIRQGQVAIMDKAQIKDRFLQAGDTARAILSDFREVEQNFRDLDRNVRQRMAEWDGSKGKLLEEVFGRRDEITESDQGKSFRSFWDFLMSPTHQEELTALLHSVFALEAVRELKPDERLLRIHHDWMIAGEVTQRTIARLSEQLRRYLDDQALLENRRIMHLIRQLEQAAVGLRDQLPEGIAMELDEPSPTVEVTMERPLFSPPLNLRIGSDAVVEGDDGLLANALFDHIYVDKKRLAGQIRWALQTNEEVSLGDLVESFPLEQGLAELVAYLSLAVESGTATIDDRQNQLLPWSDQNGAWRCATVPLVIFRVGGSLGLGQEVAG